MISFNSDQKFIVTGASSGIGEGVARRLRGIDRIVPIGQAMDIGATWDGCDLVRTLSRVISL